MKVGIDDVDEDESDVVVVGASLHEQDESLRPVSEATRTRKNAPVESESEYRHVSWAKRAERHLEHVVVLQPFAVNVADVAEVVEDEVDATGTDTDPQQVHQATYEEAKEVGSKAVKN